jgi:hypothetical protein
MKLTDVTNVLDIAQQLKLKIQSFGDRMRLTQFVTGPLGHLFSRSALRGMENQPSKRRRFVII